MRGLTYPPLAHRAASVFEVTQRRGQGVGKSLAFTSILNYQVLKQKNVWETQIDPEITEAIKNELTKNTRLSSA